MASYVDKDTVKRAHAQLRAMVEDLPEWQSFPQSYVREYTRLVQELRNAGLDVTTFDINNGQLRHNRVFIGADGSGEPESAIESRIDRTTFLTRANGLLRWLDERAAPAPTLPKLDGRAFANVTISGGNVNSAMAPAST